MTIDDYLLSIYKSRKKQDDNKDMDDDQEIAELL